MPRLSVRRRIAFRYVDDPEPGTNLVGTIEILEQIKDGAFIPALTDLAGQSAEQIKSTPINQGTFDQLASGQPTLVWPTVHSGNASGKLSMFVSADKDGHVREALSNGTLQCRASRRSAGPIA